jgi:hypothetical protein
MDENLLVRIKLISGESKNHDNGALAGSPIDIVSVAGFVMAPKIL